MLSLALIVKDEEKNLDRCLSSAQGLWDELIIVDTGSTDRTVEIAKKYTDKVYHFEWVNHFAKARNFAFSKCTQPWIMWLDADDYLPSEVVKQTRAEFERIATTRADVDYILMNYHYYVEPPTPQGTPLATQLRERIIRKEKATWVGRCHETILVDWNKSTAIPAHVAVWHLRDEEDRVKDSGRNIQLMKLCVEDDPSARNHFYLAEEYSNHGDAVNAVTHLKLCLEKSNLVDLSFQAAYKLAKKYNEDKKPDLAIEWFQKSLTYDVSYREPMLEIANIYFTRKDFKKAIYWLEASLLVKQPEHPSMAILKCYYEWIPYDLLAKCYFETKEWKKAYEASQKVYEFTRQPQILSDLQTIKAAQQASYKRRNGPVRLNLGCGNKPMAGYTNCDLFPGKFVDEVFSLDEVPYANQSVDEIHSEHSLEHLPRLRAEKALKEWARVLKPGGKILLKVPDLEDCCRKFVENPTLQERWYMHTIYGVQDFRNDANAPFQDAVNLGQIHYTGFTQSRLSRLLTEAGFLIDRIWKYDGWDTPSLAVEAHMPDILAGNRKKIAFINNSLIPKYLSYGDYWEDAFYATGHEVHSFRYEQTAMLPSGFDLYFFIEANGRYDASKISSVSPKILYTQESPPLSELHLFDAIATPNETAFKMWTQAGLKCLLLPNDNHPERVKSLIAQDWGQAQLTSPKKIVDIIIPSYKNVDYLKLSIDSVRKNTEDYRLIVVNSGEDQAVRDYLQLQRDIILIDTIERRSFSQAVNAGLNLSNNDVVILNNDVIVGPGWLPALASSPFDLCNPFSNCDAGWIHNFYPEIGDVRVRPNMSISEVNLEALMSYRSTRTEVFERPWVAFYATYVRREVIRQVGLLDTNFQNGGEDYDYCRRAKQLGFKAGHSFLSWVFHFGGKTRKVSESDDYLKHHVEDKRNQEWMAWKDRPTVAIYCGPAWERWTVKSINTTGIGGSETCAALLAQAFARKGYRSIIIGDCDGLEGNYDGVEYINHTKWEKFKSENFIDYFISSRTVAPLAHHIRNGKNYVWSHDIFIPECANQPLPLQNKVNKFICLSPWHVEFFSQNHSLNKDKIYVQGNGLDLSRYVKAERIQKDPFKLIYSSSPDRGLSNLLNFFPEIRKEFPQATLHVFYGFDNWKKAVVQRNNADEIRYMQWIEAGLKQPGVIYKGRISQKELAEEQMSSALWVYPAHFTETYCITATECMLAGAVPVCTTLAALDTTVPDGCGVKVARPEDCLPAVLDLLRNPLKQDALRQAGREHVLKNCGWDTVAENWIHMFKTT